MCFYRNYSVYSLKTNRQFAPENRPFNAPNGSRIVFQPSVFRCEVLVSGRVSFIDYTVNHRLSQGGEDGKPKNDLLRFFVEMGVNPKIWVLPPKWMVKIMVPNPMNKWMIWGETPLFLETSKWRYIDPTLGGSASKKLNILVDHHLWQQQQLDLIGVEGLSHMYIEVLGHHFFYRLIYEFHHF